jgi:hypothetical protein
VAPAAAAAAGGDSCSAAAAGPAVALAAALMDVEYRCGSGRVQGSSTDACKQLLCMLLAQLCKHFSEGTVPWPLLLLLVVSCLRVGGSATWSVCQL